jgi:hypothetical protein
MATVRMIRDAAYTKPPKRITEARFMEMLCVLPPEDWQRFGAHESFKLCEYDEGNVTGIYCRIDNDYFELHDVYTMPHLAILAACMYEQSVSALEAEGLTRSDAQGVVDARQMVKS